MRTRSTDRSRQLYERASQVIPAGVSSNSRWRHPYPLYFRSAKGAELVDADGNRYIDLVLGNGAVILGHGNQHVEESVRRGLECGLTIGVEWERTVELAELFLQVVPTMDKVRFTNTGTEAMLHAVQIARAATGRTRIAKAEGCYHGWTDLTFVSVFHDLAAAGPVGAMRPVPSTAGLDPVAVDRTVVFPFNDIERTRAVIDQHVGDLAAVVVEPIMIDIGYVPAARAYLEALREICTRHGIVLIFDEVLTSFRLAPGGAQEFYGVVPDLAIYGKAMSNGYPLAAVAGCDTLMRTTQPGSGPTFVGTFNGHVIPVSAALGALPQLVDGSVQRALEERTLRLRKAFDATASKFGLPGHLAGGAGHLQWYFNEEPVVDYRSAARSDPELCKAFSADLLGRGIFVGTGLLSHQAISMAHTDAVLDAIETAFLEALKTISRQGQKQDLAGR